MAQLVAHLHGMQGVRGSNPLSSTNKRKDTLGCLFFLSESLGNAFFVHLQGNFKNVMFLGINSLKHKVKTRASECQLLLRSALTSRRPNQIRVVAALAKRTVNHGNRKYKGVRSYV